MATAIKAIPTLYAAKAECFRKKEEESEYNFESHPQKSLKADPYYKTMKNIKKRNFNIQ
ncbi:hypothetical protein [Capnocytophaga gingivalis]|jgi:hypothetical protein